MTVQERCTVLRQRIAQGRERRQEHKGAEALRQRASELQELREKLEPVIRRVEVLQRHEMSLQEVAEVEKAKGAMSEYREALATEVGGTGRPFTRLTKAIQKLVDARQDQIESALDALDQSIGSPDDSILSVLQGFPGKQAEVARIRAEWKAVPSGKRLLTATADELASALERRRNIQAQITRLMGDIGDMPDEVSAFFRKLSVSHSVPFASVTPTVEHWLLEKKLLQHVRVSFANS